MTRRQRDRHRDGTFAVGNQARTLHGLRASGLPRSAAYLGGQLRAFRRYLRDELAERGIAVRVYQEAIIQSAVRHETRALLAAKWLRDQDGDLKLEQRIQLLATISMATDARDKCLDRLGLDKADARQTIDVLYSTATGDADEREGTNTANESSSATDAPEGTQGGDDDTGGDAA